MSKNTPSSAGRIKLSAKVEKLSTKDGKQVVAGNSDTKLSERASRIVTVSPTAVGTVHNEKTGDFNPVVHAVSSSGESRSFSVKGKNKTFKANVRKAESRAQSFIEGKDA